MEMMNCPRRHPDIVWRVEKRRQEAVLQALEAGESVDDHGTVILIHAGTMHQLNLIGGMIWERCDGSRSLERIAEELAAEFAVGRAEVAADIEDFVADLTRRGWLLNG